MRCFDRSEVLRGFVYLFVMRINNAGIGSNTSWVMSTQASILGGVHFLQWGAC